MLKNISFLALAGALTFAASTTGCILVTDDTADTLGDGDGDATTGDGDGDATTGDGDGDPTGDGDGDGDPTGDGDGDGDATGDGDGEPAGMCGWIEDPPPAGYYCGGDGEDPSGTNPLACPDGLVADEACGTVTGIGCCDAEGNNWYCGEDAEGNQFLVREEC
jgi:hypothetical protein